MRKNLKSCKSLLGTWYHGNWGEETHSVLGGAELGLPEKEDLYVQMGEMCVTLSFTNVTTNGIC